MRYLIGMNNNNEIIFAEPKLDNNGIFTCSFAVVFPFIFDEDEIDDRCWCSLDGLDAETKLDICTKFHCAPQDIIDSMDYNEKFEFVHDTSLYPNSVCCEDGNEWYFESSSCGQVDVRKDGIKTLVINDCTFNELMRLWDNYHLKKLPETEIEVYDEIMGELKDVLEDEEAFIKDMIEDNIIENEDGATI